MAKKEVREIKEEVKEQKEMTLEEAKRWRASLAKQASSAELSEEQKREAWRLYWTQEKASYGQPKDLEEILWLHLRAVDMNSPSKFEEGIKHFGLKKIS